VRPRTLSARRLPDDVPEDEKRRRNTLLLEAHDRTSARRQAALIGRQVEILVEGISKTDASRVTGRDRYNRLVHCDGDAALAGRMAVVEITEAGSHSLVGRRVAVEPARA
jgi:tRNA-2-methylthio-N6-dimethylallyladenosine synthase